MRLSYNISIHQISCKNKAKAISMYIYRGWLLHPVLYLNFIYLVANLKLSAEDLNFRPRILISGRGFESGFEDWSTNPRPMFLESDIRVEGFIKFGP